MLLKDTIQSTIKEILATYEVDKSILPSKKLKTGLRSLLDSLNASPEVLSNEQYLIFCDYIYQYEANSGVIDGKMMDCFNRHFSQALNLPEAGFFQKNSLGTKHGLQIIKNYLFHPETDAKKVVEYLEAFPGVVRESSTNIYTASIVYDNEDIEEMIVGTEHPALNNKFLVMLIAAVIHSTPRLNCLLSEYANVLIDIGMVDMLLHSDADITYAAFLAKYAAIENTTSVLTHSQHMQALVPVLPYISAPLAELSPHAKVERIYNNILNLMLNYPQQLSVFAKLLDSLVLIKREIREERGEAATSIYTSAYDSDDSIDSHDEEQLTSFCLARDFDIVAAFIKKDARTKAYQGDNFTPQDEFPSTTIERPRTLFQQYYSFYHNYILGAQKEKDFFTALCYATSHHATLPREVLHLIAGYTAILEGAQSTEQEPDVTYVDRVIEPLSRI